MSRIESSVKVVPYHDTSYLDLYEAKFLRDGMAILENAKVLDALRKQATILMIYDSDVHITDKPVATYTHGVVSIEMTWGSQEEIIGGVRKESHKMLIVAARLATRKVVVSTSDGWQVLAKSDWKNPNKLWSAISNGVDNPLSRGKVLGEVR